MNNHLEDDPSKCDLSSGGSCTPTSSTYPEPAPGDNLLETPDMTSDLPDRLGSVGRETICYGDIELFILRNPEKGERNVIIATVDFRNLKGRPEGANGYV